MDSLRTHKWQELSGPEVAALAQQTDVALLPIGCVETHGPHLPTGTDAIHAECMAELIAAREPAIILPTLYYNINDEMACYPGAIAISPELVGRLYEELCCEAARNGFRKIIFLIGHGGSEEVTRFMQRSFLQRRLGERIGFAVFEVSLLSSLQLPELWDTHGETQWHAGESETSFVLHFRPDLVHIDRLEPLPAGEGPVFPKRVQGAWYEVDWIRVVPKGYTGMPQLATAEKGARAARLVAERCAEIVRQVRAFDPSSDP